MLLTPTGAGSTKQNQGQPQIATQGTPGTRLSAQIALHGQHICNRLINGLIADVIYSVKNCALEGEDYAATYGAKAADDSLTLSFVTTGPYATNVGSRFYLLDGDDKYKQFKLLDAEFTFDVDVSKLPCGLNGALYFVSMDEDGGKAKYPGSPGPSMGYGYCDAQCARDLKVLGGTVSQTLSLINEALLIAL